MSGWGGRNLRVGRARLDGWAVKTETLLYSTPFRYSDRGSKSRYIAEKYRAILGGRVLDVGCDTRRLSRLLPDGASYVGVDLNDAADVVLNLDREALPFGDRTFETVVCADTLEHLDRIHAVFDELCRVAEGRVVVSLPNPLRNLLLSLDAGRRAGLKHYGLPVEQPADRHRWFFGAEEAEAFVRRRASSNRFVVEQLDFEERGLPAALAGLHLGGVELGASPNCVLGTMWAVLRRKER